MRRPSSIALGATAIVVGAMTIGAARRMPTTTTRQWYGDGRVAEERTWRGGREEGTHRGSWPDGRMRFEYTYRDGLLEGVSREWFPSGALWREQYYHEGREAGLQRMYWEDGRVRASYVVRDGRRYGLLGAKGCVTRDSVVASPLARAARS
jgi:hypothetical protein